MRTPQCNTLIQEHYESEGAYLGGTADSCCGECILVVNDADVYYWPDTLRNSSSTCDKIMDRPAGPEQEDDTMASVISSIKLDNIPVTAVVEGFTL